LSEYLVSTDPEAGAVAPALRAARARRKPFARAQLLLPTAVVLLFCVMAAFPGLFAGWFGHPDPRVCDLARSGQPPTVGHPFGFDIQGCDLYSNVIHGARASITIGLLATAMTLVIAVVLGSIAGYAGGVTDGIISRVMDVFFGFPWLVGMIVLLQMANQHSVLTVSLVLAFFSWPGLTRVMRASTLGVVNLDYVTAARSIGASPLRILFRHVGINAVGPVAVLAGLNVGAIITAEAALTFLGVGLRAPTISWGVQLNLAQQYFTTDPHLLMFPALFLCAAVLSFVLLGDALRDLLDARLR
jgi:ABC-type dipeptide/oligopeptide/nickel transport system permease subunit